MAFTDKQYAQTVLAMESSVESELRSAIESRKTAILGTLGFVARLFVGPLWSAILALAPLLAGVAVRVLLTWILNMSVNDLLDFIDKHRIRAAGSKGGRP